LSEYQERRSAWAARADAAEKSHLTMGNWRLAFFAALVVGVFFFCRSWLGVGVGFLVLTVAVFVSGMFHDRILRARDAAQNAVRFYELGLRRLDGSWPGQGTPGSEFLEPHHTFAGDLDLFGQGSLFELVNTTQTDLGRARLASWLVAPASRGEIVSRQEAIRELTPKADLRERLGTAAADAQRWIHAGTLLEWARQPAALRSTLLRGLLFCLPWLTLVLYLTNYWLGLAALVAQGLVARQLSRRVKQVTRGLSAVQSDLKWLSTVLEILERESFQSERLRRLDAACRSQGVGGSSAIRRLARLYDWVSSAQNQLAVLFCRWLMWETQFAFAIEAWRARFGPKLEPWLERLAETETLSALAGYAFEHPSDLFPEFLPEMAAGQLTAEGLGHPLLAETVCVRNDVALGPDCRLLIISGSNMSGKSTYLRAIGVNVVLALAGAPVRARRFRLTPLQIGASIRTVDSLQEGTSRFYAEIKRLADVVKLTARPPTLLFLLDEILGGTNSHDRRIGAAGLARSLVERGAIGLITTHDLALTKIAADLQPPGANFHFEDQLTDGRMTFDYILRPGVVEKSNALELMRSLGLDIKP
jgi:hypothetical protein